MSVTALREITIGVGNLAERSRQFESGLGLSVVRSGPVTSMTARRLFDTHVPLTVAILARTDVAGSPRLRLVEARDQQAARSGGLASPGPLGVGFTTRGIANVHARIEASGVRFISPPLLLTPMSHARPENAPPGPQRFEAFGRAADGDFIVLIERVNAETPYGTFITDCSEPLHASFIVTNLDACTHFMIDVLQHETLLADTCSGGPFDALLGLPKDVSFRFAMPHRPGYPTGRCVFMEFEKRPHPMPQTPGLAPGICRLRYDCADLHSVLARVPGGGGSLVRGPASLDDPVLGRGLVAMVRAPFGVLIELWQTGPEA